MRMRYLRQHYADFATILSLVALLLFGYTNCQEIRLKPLELKDPQSLH